MGGNAAGAARNTFGLAHAISFLIETRGVGIGRESFQRRVATHYLAAKAVLETAADRAAELRETREAARRAATTDTSDIVVAHKVNARPMPLPMRDPVTGEAKPTPVTFRDSRDTAPTVVRSRPAGYLVPDLGTEAIAALRLNTIAICRTVEAVEVDAEMFIIKERGRTIEREAINPDQAIKADVARKRITVGPGTAFVPARQPGGTLASLALEPDSPGSLAGVGLIPLLEGADLPVYRVTVLPRLAPIEPRDAAVCTP
jgi:hypothetical protein